MLIPDQALRGLSPLHVLIKQVLSFFLPDFPNELCLGTIPEYDIRLELYWVDKYTVCQIIHIWHNLRTRLYITSPAKIKCPQEARDGKVHGALSDMGTLAEAPPGAEGEVVAAAYIRVKR